MAIIKAISPGKSRKALLNAIDYITREDKTTHALISGLNCNPDTVKEEMSCTKNFFGKVDGRQYMHFVQSFPSDDEISPEKANEIAIKLAKEMFPGYEVLMATHTDREHIHTHFIVNSVRLEDGVKIRMSKRDLQHMKNLSDRLCMERDLSICKKGVRNVGIVAFSMEKYIALKKASQKLYKSYVLNIAKEVFRARETSCSQREFIEKLKEKGVETLWSDTRKHIVFVDAEGNKLRNSNIQKTFGIRVEKADLLEIFEERSRANEVVRAAMRVNYLGKENVGLEAECLAMGEILRESDKLENLKEQVKQIEEAENRIDLIRKQIGNTLREYEDTKWNQIIVRSKLKAKLSDMEEKVLYDEKQIENLLGEWTKEKMIQLVEERTRLEVYYSSRRKQITCNFEEIRELYRKFGELKVFRDGVRYDEFGEVPARATREQVSEAKGKVVSMMERLRNGESEGEENTRESRIRSREEVKVQLDSSMIPLDELIASLKRTTGSKEVECVSYREYDLER